MNQQRITDIYTGILMGSTTGNFMSLEDAQIIANEYVQSIYNYSAANSRDIRCFQDFVDEIESLQEDKHA